jgi:hypothetical protein
MSNESRVEVDKSEEVAQGWQHALSHMVSTDDLEPSPLPTGVAFVWLRSPWELVAFEDDSVDSLPGQRRGCVRAGWATTDDKDFSILWNRHCALFCESV